MAEVHAAYQRGEGDFVKLVAVKTLLPHLAEDPKFVDMFLDEARISALVSSARVVQTLGLGRGHDGLPFLVMDLVIGVTLAELAADALRSGDGIPIPIAAEIVAQAAEGLDDIHRARSPAGKPLAIVHRDVSPQNILVGADGSVRVGDFGIAHAAERYTRTETGELKGKLAYYSPEQARAEPLDPRSDVFALAVTAWEIFAKRPLFSGPTARLLEAVKEQPIDRLDLVSEVPKALADAIAHALERDQDHRTASARDLAFEIRRALDPPLPASGDIAELVRRASGKRIEKLESRLSTEAERAADPGARAPTDRSAIAYEPTVAKTPVPKRRSLIPFVAIAMLLGILALLPVVFLLGYFGSSPRRGGAAEVPRAVEEARPHEIVPVIPPVHTEPADVEVAPIEEAPEQPAMVIERRTPSMRPATVEVSTEPPVVETARDPHFGGLDEFGM
jgi:serine/threonine protein kinase